MAHTAIDLRERAQRPPAPLAMVYGGGGAVGIAWHLAVIAGLTESGFDCAAAPSIGTSAGSWACGAARYGLGMEAFMGFESVELPNRRAGLLYEMAHSVFGDARAQDVWVSAVALPTMRRHLFSAQDHDLAHLIAASSAVPGVFSPHQIRSTSFVDGGVRSMASAEDAPPARLLIASLPIAGPLFGPVGRAMERRTRNALNRWRRGCDGSTMVLRPGPRFVEAVGAKPNALMDVALAKSVYPVALDTVRRRLDSRLPQLERQGVRLTAGLITQPTRG